MVASGTEGNALWKQGREEGEYLHSEGGLLLEQVSRRNFAPSAFEDTENMTRRDNERPYLILKVAQI